MLNLSHTFLGIVQPDKQTEVIQALLEALKDDDSDVREAAAQALEKLSVKIWRVVLPKFEKEQNQNWEGILFLLATFSSEEATQTKNDAD